MIPRIPETVMLAVCLGTAHAWIPRVVDPVAVRSRTTTPSVVGTPVQLRQSRRRRSASLLRRHASARTPPPHRNQDDDDDSDSDNEEQEQDEDCAQEDECEIDWDTMMPPTDTTSSEYDEMAVATMKEQLERQFASTTSTSSASTSGSSTSNSIDDTNIPAIERYGDSRRTVTSHTLRQRLEMQWQVTDLALLNDECDVYQPASCGGQACTTCQGRGHAVCRFCQGTCQLQLRTVHDDGTVETANVACQICNASGQESCRACQGTGWVADWTSIGGGVHVGGNSNNHRPPTRSGGLLP